MADEVKPGTEGAGAGPQGQPAGDFKMPEKFANAKPEDIAKAYVELEKQYGTASSKLGTLSEYEKLGSTKDLADSLTWARETYQKIQSGELTPKQAQRQAEQRQQQQQNAPQAPWAAEGWDFLPPAEQAAKMSQYNTQQVAAQVMEQVNKIAAAYGTRIDDMRATQSREQSIMLKVLQAAQSSGGKIDIAKALEAASEMATKAPEEYIDLAIKNMLSPDEVKAEVERQVTARVAEEKQKMANENVDNLSRIASPQPRFAQSIFKTRNDENKSIVEKLQKQGINF
jgi:hypothetical protein